VVDFDANFGLGFEVECVIIEEDYLEKNEEESYIYPDDEDILDKLLEGTEYELIKWGDLYSEDAHYGIVLKEPVVTPTIVERIQELESFLKRKEGIYICYRDSYLIGGEYIT